MENEDARERLALAVVALQRGDKPEARRLLHALLSEDPTNVAAWYWACQAGDTAVERRYCLKRLLELDPGNEPVRRYLSQLTPAEKGTSLPVSPATPSGEKDAFSFKVTDLFWGPIAFSLQLPPFVLVSLFVFLVSVVVVTSYRANTSFFGLSTPDFDNLRISEDCDSLDSAGPCWNVVYESSEETVFVGDVRYIAPMRMWRIPFMTHNILVTSGDFSDPDKVETKVNGEALKWRSIGTPYPEGRINFLHAFPTDETIYKELLAIREGDYVTITGQEILKVEVYDEAGQYRGRAQDAGCNSLRVTAVEIFSP